MIGSHPSLKDSMIKGNGFFIPTEIGDFHPTLIGYYRPTLTTLKNKGKNYKINLTVKGENPAEEINDTN